MIRTVIVEDEPKNLSILKIQLKEFCSAVEVVGTATNIIEAREVISSTQPDLVLLDIVLPYGNAFDLLAEIMPINFKIIFLTAHDEHAIKAIKFSTIDYLLKPIDIDELIQAIKKVKETLALDNVNTKLTNLLSHLKEEKATPQKIAVPTVDGLYFIQIDDIIRCEANGTYTMIYQNKNQKLLASKNIKEFEEILPSSKFIRIHNAHLINLNKLVKYNKGRGGIVLMEDGSEIEVASRRKADFLNKFL
jgi:two-component system LytT family response regulator